MSGAKTPRSLICLAVVLLLLPVACRREDDDKGFSTYVYVAGEMDNVPCIWKNGVPNILEFPAWEIGCAYSLFVSKNDVYAAGCILYPMRSFGVPMYWKNGARVDLPLMPRDMGGVANGIWVEAGDIYVSGFRAVSYYTTTTVMVLAMPCYWKNGGLVSLSVASMDVGGHAESIFISGNDVYLAGRVVDESGDFDRPCYWRNGLRVDLGIPGACRSGSANSLFVADGDVYVSGTVASESRVSIPGYWINGAWTELSKPDPGKYCWTSGLSVEGRDVHVCGAGYGADDIAMPCTWTNGVRRDLPASPGSRTEDIQVFAGDVYVVGNDKITGPCYWKNGVKVDLGGNGEAVAIRVVGP